MFQILASRNDYPFRVILFSLFISVQIRINIFSIVPDKFLSLQITLIDLSDLYLPEIFTSVKVGIIIYSILIPDIFLSLQFTLIYLPHLFLTEIFTSL